MIEIDTQPNIVYSEYKRVYFKKPFSDNFKWYNICNKWTKQELIQFLRPKVLIDFNLLDFKLIEVGQPLAELAPEINIAHYTLEQIWGEDLNVAFYLS